MKRLALALASLFLLAFVDPPSEQLADPRQEARARALFDELRCVVCQNENIAASQADVAHLMRMDVRKQVAAGKSTREIKDYFYQRYGNYIFLKPRFSAGTAVLWIGPFLIVLIGLGVLLLRRRKPIPLEESLSTAELKALEALETNDQVRDPA